MGRLKDIGIDVDVHRAIEQGRRTFSESENDILRRLLKIDRPIKPSLQSNRSRPTDIASRSRGLWSVELRGIRTPAANLKDAYRTALLQLAALSDQFLPSFAGEKARSRRFVARDPKDLYLSSPHLADDYAEPLIDGWYFDTNLSTEQVAARVRIAARVAGLRYGSDVRILENLREI